MDRDRSSQLQKEFEEALHCEDEIVTKLPSEAEIREAADQEGEVGKQRLFKSFIVKKPATLKELALVCMLNNEHELKYETQFYTIIKDDISFQITDDYGTTRYFNKWMRKFNNNVPFCIQYIKSTVQYWQCPNHIEYVRDIWSETRFHPCGSCEFITQNNWDCLLFKFSTEQENSMLKHWLTHHRDVEIDFLPAVYTGVSHFSIDSYGRKFYKELELNDSQWSRVILAMHRNNTITPKARNKFVTYDSDTEHIHNVSDNDDDEIFD